MVEIRDSFIYRLHRREAKQLLSALEKLQPAKRLSDAQTKALDDLKEALEWDVMPCVER